MSDQLQESQNKQLLLNSSENTVQMGQFPTYKLDPDPIKSQQQLPQFFQLGGNKQLNKRLFKYRQQKLLELQKRNIITCQGLNKSYVLQGQVQQVIALKNITLIGSEKGGSIKEGQFVIIRGPSGGGKTTFLNIIGTIDNYTMGSLTIDEQAIQLNTKDSELSKLRRDKIGIVFQSFNLLALMSAYENIELPMRIRGILNENEMKQRTKMLLGKVNLSDRSQHLPSQLSGGQQQRVAIARALANSPSIILLDEPTGDLDSKSTIEIMNIILEINNFGYNNNKIQQNRTTIIMVTHNPDLQCYADRVIFFHDGQIYHQVYNQYQFALNPDQYCTFLNTKI